MEIEGQTGWIEGQEAVIGYLCDIMRISNKQCADIRSKAESSKHCEVEEDENCEE